eukprot:364040-Chlamydomonas_euryale.AAC.10
MERAWSVHHATPTRCAASMRACTNHPPNIHRACWSWLLAPGSMTISMAGHSHGGFSMSRDRAVTSFVDFPLPCGSSRPNSPRCMRAGHQSSCRHCNLQLPVGSASAACLKP